MQDKNTTKLFQYSLMAAILGSLDKKAEAQIIYTDFDPDLSWEWGSGVNLNIDMDSDGFADFKLITSASFTSSYSAFGSAAELFILPFGDNEIAQDTLPEPTPSSFPLASVDANPLFYNQHYGADLFLEGDTIQAELDWGTPAIVIGGICCSPGEGTWGEFVNNDTTDYYIGVKFYNPELHYGWIRLMNTHDQDDQIIKGIAYEAAPDTPLPVKNFIAAPVVPAVSLLRTEGENTTAELSVSFDPAPDESAVSAYRVIILPDGDELSADMAGDVLPENYIDLLPSGSALTVSLSAGFNTWSGIPINAYEDYRAFVLSVFNEPASNENAVSAVSNKAHYTDAADTVQTLLLADTGSPGNSSNFQISFSMAENENTISEYRIIMTDSYNAPVFDLILANAVDPANYISAVPSGSDISLYLPENFTTFDGTPIHHVSTYHAFILSVSNDPYSFSNSLSLPSNGAAYNLATGFDDPVSAISFELNYEQEHFDISLENGDECLITIYDLNGKILYEDIFSSAQLSIPLNLPSGIYFVKVKTERGSSTKKIIVD